MPRPSFCRFEVPARLHNWRHSRPFSHTDQNHKSFVISSWLNMKRVSNCCSMSISKKAKYSKPLPAELIWELIMCIPMMRLFVGSAEKKRWLSMISPINWRFETLRQSRKNEYTVFKNRLAMLSEKFNSACELRKVTFDKDQLFSVVFRIKDQLSTDQNFAEFLQFLCFSQFNNGLVTDNFSVASPLNNSILNGKLCEHLIDFVLCSPNPFSMRKRICVGVMLPKDLPKHLTQPACDMNCSGILPQVRSDGNTVYFLYNAQMMKKVGYISMFFHVKVDDGGFIILMTLNLLLLA